MLGRISRYARRPRSEPPNSSRHRSKMNVDRPSKNLMTTLPRTASQTTTSAMCRVRSLPSTLPSKRRSEASSSSVARWIRASPLPFSSPIDRSATRGLATPRTRSAKIAPICAYWTRFSGVESGFAPMSSSTIGPGGGDHLDGQRRPVDAGQATEAQDRGGHPGPGVTGGDDRVGLAALDEVDRDQDRRVLLLAEGERRDARPSRRPGWPGRSRRSPAATRRGRGSTASSPTRITRSSGCARA